MFRLAPAADSLDPDITEFVVSDGDDDGVVGAGFRFVDRAKAKGGHRLVTVHVGVEHVHRHVELAQLVDDIDDTGIAQVRAVLLERQAHDQYPGILHMDASLGQALDQLIGHVGAHAVIDTAAGQDDLGMVANLLRLVGQIVGVHADAVPAHQARTEGQEVPFGAGRFQHLFGVDAQTLEDDGQFVDQGDVDVALGILDDLGGLGHGNRAGPEGAGGDDRGVELIDEVGAGRRRAGGHLADVGDPMLAITGIDALRAVAGEEVAVVAQPGQLLDDRDALVFGGARIDRRLEDHDITFGNHPAHRGTGPQQRCQVGIVLGVDRGGDRDDVDIGVGQPGRLIGETQQRRQVQLAWCHFSCGIDTVVQLSDTLGTDIEAQSGVALAEFDRQRQADIAKPDDRDACLVQRQ